MALIPWVPHIHRHIRHAELLSVIMGMKTLTIGSLIRGNLIHSVVHGTISPWIDLGEFISIYPPMEDFDPAEMNTEQYWG